MAQNENDQKISEVLKRIETERKVLQASQLLRQATTNPEVLRQTDAQRRESERSLSYFEGVLRDLQQRKAAEAAGGPAAGGDPARYAGGLPSSPQAGRPGQHSPTASFNNGGRGSGDVRPGGQQGPKQYSNLDLIRAETPYTPAKISRMLHQLEFKLQVEKQYKAGIDKMARLYQADGDKKSRADAEAKRVESDRKIALLQTALKRYKNLHVLDVVDDDEDDGQEVDGQRKENLRNKPLSGKLQVTIKGARELEHIPIPNAGKSRSSSKKVVETYVNIKVEGTQHARTHSSRTDKWLEDFEIPVDKANEVEIAIYDKQVGDANPVPIGLLWVRISDLVEAVRRQKVMMDTAGQGGWVTAGAMHGAGGPDSSVSGSFQQPYGAGGDVTLGFPAGPPGGMSQGSQVDGVDGWFAVEPAGAIALHLNFVKENIRKRAADRPGGLGRQGAVRARKEEVHEMNGHKFVQRQFYQIVLCAFCNEFLLNAVGYQCEDCKYTCHKKCYEKVVTKCISKSNVGDDEEKINHRIPHRFEPLTNIGANWCCHCGLMLPLGRKNARRCSECDITCHANCAHLVPDFCGMSMETANQLLRDWKDINRARGGKPGPAGRPPSKIAQQHTPQRPSVSEQQLAQGFDRLRLEGGQQSPPPPEAYPAQSPPPALGQLPPDPRYAAPPLPPQPQMGYPGTPGQASRPLPATRTSMGFPEPQPSPRPASGDQYFPPAGPEGYGAVPPYDRTPQPPPKPYPPSPAPAAAQLAARPDRPSSLPGSPQIPPSIPHKQPLPPQPQQLPAQPQAPLPPQQQQQVAPPQQARPSGKPKRKVGLDDFNFLAVLGKGNFGKVMLAEEKRTNGLYAIKVLKKEFIIENDEVESTRSEKRVFMTAARERHPFLLGLHSCFQTETRVYFVMEYVSGGDLMLHIQRKQFSLRQAKFYACEVLLALEYFHQNGIVYRDLKLDNILLTLDGHVKVADYGLCKEEMWFGSTTSTFCGTPEFMAPEILLEQRYGRAVDWWAFGVLMYEMLLGQSPFRGDDEDEIFDAILEDEPLYPITMPRDAVAILQKLLTRDPNRRLGSSKADGEDIKKQPFFKDVNWDDVFHKRIPPPYCPTINGSADTSNFDEEFTKEKPTLTPVHGQLTARDQAEFNGFSWVAQWADI